LGAKSDGSIFVVGMKEGTVKVYDEEFKFKKNFK
jgi:hypothetical protein